MGTIQGGMTARITREFRRANSDDIIAGVEWYQKAHLLAEELAFEYGHTLEQASAVIAALSPQLSWGMNVKVAREVFAAGTSGGVLKANLAKAQRILEGEEIRSVLGRDDVAKSGFKVRAFHRCILTAGRDEYAVCVDRHAHALAVGTRDTPSLTAKRYREVAHAFRQATKILNAEEPQDLRPILTPSAVQATVWITWRRRFWADGANDPEGF